MQSNNNDSRSSFYQPTKREIDELFDRASREYIALGHRYALKHQKRGQFSQRDRLRFIAQRVFHVLPINGTFVDIGAGSGILTRMVHYTGKYRAIGVECKDTAGEEDMRHLQRSGIEGYFCCVGKEPLPFDDSFADVAIAANVIEHLYHSPKGFLESMFRILKPGGILILETDNAISMKTRLRVMAGISNWAPIDSFYGDEFNIHHHKEYTLSELITVLKWAGFVNVQGEAYEALWQVNLRKLGRQGAMDATSSYLTL